MFGRNFRKKNKRGLLNSEIQNFALERGDRSISTLNRSKHSSPPNHLGDSSNNITKEENTHIKISQQAYQTTRANNIYPGYTYQPLYSNKTTAVYYNTHNKHLIIGYRGTSDLNDAGTDFSLIKHEEDTSDRFRADNIQFNHIVDKLHPRTITVTGHSLGGAVAMYINDHNDNVNWAYVINPGFNLNNIFNSYTKRNNVTVFRTKHDLVSAGSIFGGYKVKTLPMTSKGFLNDHKLNNFLAN
jgi:hypothetical protein